MGGACASLATPFNFPACLNIPIIKVGNTMPPRLDFTKSKGKFSHRPFGCWGVESLLDPTAVPRKGPRTNAQPWGPREPPVCNPAEGRVV